MKASPIRPYKKANITIKRQRMNKEEQERRKKSPVQIRIKSIRAGKASLTDSFCYITRGEMWVEGMNISPYFYGSYANHEARRTRKLLLNRREIKRLEAEIKTPGYTIVPLLVFIDEHGRAKMDIALARGKKMYDKRQTLKEKEDRREMDRAVKRY